MKCKNNFLKTSHIKNQIFRYIFILLINRHQLKKKMTHTWYLIHLRGRAREPARERNRFPLASSANPSLLGDVAVSGGLWLHLVTQRVRLKAKYKNICHLEREANVFF